MKNNVVELTIPISQSAMPNVNAAQLNESNDDFTFGLKNGANIVATSRIDLNAFQRSNSVSENLTGSLELHYEFLEDMSGIKLASSDYAGKYAPALTLYLGKDSLGTISLASTDSAGHSNSALQEMDYGLRCWIKGIADLTIENAKSKGLMVFERKDPPTIQSKDFDDTLLVYRNGSYYGVHDEKKTYDSGFEIVPLKSVFGGTVDVNVGKAFWNVLGSTGDPLIVGSASFIEEWAQYSKVNLDNLPRPDGCIAHGSANRGCNSWYEDIGDGNNKWRNLYGGHIVFCSSQVTPTYGVDKVVALLPICNHHNNRSNTDAMFAEYSSVAVWLDKYHK